ncbi:hypothetical protein [Peribacillus simplex]|nr:hypothetical protein [Peribacillus simplex]WHX89129.1 hypothetical protein QNH50_13605 [Peribacillus simplex]
MPIFFEETGLNVILEAFFGETHDGLPTIGMFPNHPNCYFL